MAEGKPSGTAYTRILAAAGRNQPWTLIDRRAPQQPSASLTFPLVEYIGCGRPIISWERSKIWRRVSAARASRMRAKGFKLRVQAKVIGNESPFERT